MKYIVISGGVISSLGKGIFASSLGLLLKSYGIKVTIIKIDPYLNRDAGTMAPSEHGECFVLNDGGECDLDMGNYERFLNIDLTKDHNITGGKILGDVIKKERDGDYLGKTVQYFPHVTGYIQEWLISVAEKNNNEVCIIEIGGVIGDYENVIFVKAIKQLSMSNDHEVFFIHLSLLIDNGEVKTKPAQHSIRDLNQLGIFPDMFVLRTHYDINDNIINKISLMCEVKRENIIINKNVDHILKIPDLLKKQKICEKISSKLNLNINNCNLDFYYSILDYLDKDYPQVNIAIIGKYAKSLDPYLSLIEAIKHSAFYKLVKCNIDVLDSEEIEKDNIDITKYQGFIVAGGFGSRGIEGKIKICKYARDNDIPYLGICLGMHVSVVEYSRYLGYDYTSSEWKDSGNFIVDILPDQTGEKGGTMRLGLYETKISENSLAYKIYGKDKINERHRHRYEINNSLAENIKDGNFIFSGINEENDLMEICELKSNKFHISCQYHPELISRYNKPEPLFISLLEAVSV